MLVSTKGRYALRVMIELAGHDREEFVPLGMIAKKQDISVKYLESIIVVLSKAGLVDGLRGKGGGYRLNRAPGEYSVGQILRLTEGSLAPVACLNCAPNTSGSRARNCRSSCAVGSAVSARKEAACPMAWVPASVRPAPETCTGCCKSAVRHASSLPWIVRSESPSRCQPR